MEWIWIHIMILMWGPQKCKLMLHDLCISICVSIGLHLLPMNMSVELPFDFKGWGVVKVCAIWLQLGGEHTLSGWPSNDMCLLFNVKP